MLPIVHYANVALDQVATNLSKFDRPDIPALGIQDGALGRSIEYRLLNALDEKSSAEVRATLTNIARQAFGSIETYQLGRQHALVYANGREKARVKPYFLALVQLEACITALRRTASC